MCELFFNRAAWVSVVLLASVYLLEQLCELIRLSVSLGDQFVANVAKRPAAFWPMIMPFYRLCYSGSRAIVAEELGSYAIIRLPCRMPW